MCRDRGALTCSVLTTSLAKEQIGMQSLSYLKVGVQWIMLSDGALCSDIGMARRRLSKSRILSLKLQIRLDSLWSLSDLGGQEDQGDLTGRKVFVVPLDPGEWVDSQTNQKKIRTMKTRRRKKRSPMMLSICFRRTRSKDSKNACDGSTSNKRMKGYLPWRVSVTNAEDGMLQMTNHTCPWAKWLKWFRL